MAEGAGYSFADLVAATSGNGGFGGNGGMWIAILFLFVLLGAGGFGGNRFNNAIGYENLATSSEVQRGFDAQNSMASQREILAAVNAGTAQAVAATNQAKYDNINVAKDIQMALASELGRLETQGASILANQNQCCCNTLRAIDGVNYANAQNTASINATTTAQTQKILDALAQNRIDAMQNKINQLELQNAVAGVVRYPNGWTYNAGTSPFCSGCGCMA